MSGTGQLFSKRPCLFPLPDGRRCCECAACQPEPFHELGAGDVHGARAGSPTGQSPSMRYRTIVADRTLREIVKATGRRRA